MKLTELDEGIDGLIKALTQVPTALTPLEAGDELESTMSKIDHHFAQGLLGHDHGTTEEYGPGQGLSNPPASFPRLARVIRSYGRRGRTTNSPNIPPPDAEPVLNACESTFNIEGYPHILSAVIRLSDTRTLHNLRLTNKAVKDKVERELCRHLVVEVEAYGDEAKLSSMQHGSLPMLYNIPALRPVPGNYQGIDYAAPAICANIYQNIFNMAVTADVWTTVRTLLLVRRISLLVEPDYYTPIEHAKAKAVRMYFWEQQPLRNSPLASPLSPEKLMMFMSLRRPRGDAQDAFIWLMDGIPIPPGTTQIYFEIYFTSGEDRAEYPHWYYYSSQQMCEIEYPPTVRKVEIRLVPDGQFCPDRSVLQLPATGWPHTDAVEQKLFSRWHEGITTVIHGADALPGGDEFKNKIIERVLPKDLKDKNSRKRWASQHIKFLPSSATAGVESNEADGTFEGNRVQGGSS